jgi:hypothetical protein
MILMLMLLRERGFLNTQKTLWESFKFTTDANGFFSASYNSQKDAYVQISAYAPGAGSDYSEGLWHADNSLPDAYNAGVIKIKL